MDSFFTDTLTLKTLADAWSARKQELRTLQRTLARDELLAHLKTHCISNMTNHIMNFNRSQFFTVFF